MRQPVRAILSGPAGGVNAAAFLGEQIGRSRIIAFDMGGTSTDISLIEDGIPHLTTEKFEAGWKISVPMIDIHTLGAGGGSIARVDEGGLLHVGPDSAGADPGPACYGKGGLAPTVTDANLALGYLTRLISWAGGSLSMRPWPGDALERHIAQPLGLSTVEAAYGVSRVVSTAIAEGIRLMSVQRGVDPREFALLAFGGASGLQDGQIARQLQVERVYIPAAAPVLSAYGMLCTDLKYDFSRSHPVSLDSIDLSEVRSILAELEAAGRRKLEEQGQGSEDVEVQASADMRYLDQIYEVNVPVPDLGQDDNALLAEWEANFHRRYQELFSYRQQDQEVRLVTLRVTVVGKLPRVSLPSSPPSDSAVEQKGTRRAFFGEWLEVPVYDMAGLPAGAEIEGPCILESDFTTVVLEDGDRAVADRMGGVDMFVGMDSPQPELGAASPDASGDPITLAVIEHRLESIALEMTEVMLRTSMSQILNSSRDFSTAILDADCQLVAQGEGIPVHISALPVAARRCGTTSGMTLPRRPFHPERSLLRRQPPTGHNHHPAGFPSGEVAVLWGQPRPSQRCWRRDSWRYNPAASEIFHEGLRIPPLRLYDRGNPRQDVLQMLSANVRQSENFLGDLNAQIGSVMIAAQRIQSLLEGYGPDRLLSAVAGILSATESQVRNFISGWPDGVYHGESFVRRRRVRQ